VQEKLNTLETKNAELVAEIESLYKQREEEKAKVLEEAGI